MDPQGTGMGAHYGRFCMGAAWRDMQGRKTNLKNICEMVSEIKGMGMEVW